MTTTMPIKTTDEYQLIEPDEEVRDAAMQPVLKKYKWWWPTVGVLSALVLLGVVAWVIQLADGLGVAGYNNRAFWSVYETDLIFFIGVSYGGAVVSAILRLTGASWRAPLTRIAEATSLVTLPVGMSMILPHLGNPIGIWELVWPPYWNLSSPVLWDFFAVSTYLLATIVFFYLPLIPDLKATIGRIGAEQQGLRARFCRWFYNALGNRWNGTPPQRRLLHGALGLLAIMIIPIAVSVHSVLSFAFSSSSRPGYFETILPVHFVVAALYTGIALVIVVAAALRRVYHLERFITKKHFVRLGFIIAAFGAAYFYLTFTEYLVDSYSGTTDVASWVRQILIGRYWVPFWFYVVAGGAVPLIVMAMKRTRNIKGVVTASALAIVSMWFKRLVIVLPSVTEPLITSPATKSGTLAATWGTYHFTWVPISITVAGVAMIALLLLVLFKFVPILNITEMEEMQADGEVIKAAEEIVAKEEIGRSSKIKIGENSNDDVS